MFDKILGRSHRQSYCCESVKTIGPVVTLFHPMSVLVLGLALYSTFPAGLAAPLNKSTSSAPNLLIAIELTVHDHCLPSWVKTSLFSRNE